MQNANSPNFRILVQNFAGEKRVYTTIVRPLFSRSVARPRGHRAKKAMVYTSFLEKEGKRVYTIGPERRVYTIEPQTRKKKKRRVSTVVVYTFFFLFCAEFFENKTAAQRKSFRDGYPADILASFRRMSRVKNFGQALDSLEKQAFGFGHPWSESVDVPDPGRQNISNRKTLG